MSERSALPAWQALQSHAHELSSTHLRNLFQADPAARFDALHIERLDLLFDFSRQRLTARTIELLVDLARACGLEERIAALFAGEPVNQTARDWLVAELGAASASSSPCRPTRRRWMHSGSRLQRVSPCGTGWAAGTRCGRRSGFRSHWRSGCSSSS